jgi:predicted pyridoxine 5'-phosphate oxidase superfamily flavin-nucleotide-binding protein
MTGKNDLCGHIKASLLLPGARYLPRGHPTGALIALSPLLRPVRARRIEFTRKCRISNVARAESAPMAFLILVEARINGKKEAPNRAQRYSGSGRVTVAIRFILLFLVLGL